MKNYSKQREAVLNVVKSTKSHPTANSVYDEAKKQIANISLGTVYRNLSDLAESGDIACLSLGDGVEHYDGDTSPHLHLVCKRCGRIYDVFCDISAYLDIAEKLGFEWENMSFSLGGICSECQNKK